MKLFKKEHTKPPEIEINNNLIVIKLFEKKKSMHLWASMKNNVIVIEDIKCEIENKGYGTVLMNALLEIAKEKGMKKITAQIVPPDDRLRHFYEKFGFTINPDNTIEMTF